MAQDQDFRFLPRLYRSAEPLEVEVLNELRQWRFPRVLPVVGDLAELARVQAEFASHLHLRMREAVPLARLSPGLYLERKGLRNP